MLLSDFKVTRPKTTKIQTRNDVKYVYQVIGSEYKKEKKYTVDKRVLIGRMIDDESMIPNERFIEFYPELVMTETEPPEFSDTLKVGVFSLINKIMKNLELDVLLESIYPDYAEIIKDLIMYILTDETSTFQHFTDFMYNHLSFEGKIRSDSYLSKILKRDIDSKSIELFMQAWSKLNNSLEGVYLSYDGSNVNTTAEGIQLAEYGYAKDDDTKPQVNISYVVNQENSMPLMYEIYDGSIIDNSQCVYMLEKLKEYGYHDVCLILDRGYFSRGNIREIRNKGYHFIMMVKDSNVCIKEAVKQVGVKLRLNNKYYIGEHRVFGITLNDYLFHGDKEKVYIHIYYDNVRAEESRNEWLEYVYRLEKELETKVDDMKSRKENLIKYEKLFVLKYDNYGYLKGYKRRETKIQETTDKLGYFSLITSKEMTAEEALEIYRDRDVVEKVFRSIKSEMDYSKFGVHSESSLLAKTHIIFIASIVRSVMGQQLKELYKKDRKRFTIPASLRELDKIEVTRNNKGRYIRKYALTSRQKQILKVFEIDEKALDKMIYENADYSAKIKPF